MSLMSKVRVVRQCLGVRSLDDPRTTIIQEESEIFNIPSSTRRIESKVSDMNLSDISGRGSIMDEESLLNYQLSTIHPILRHELELKQQNSKFRNILYGIVIFAILLTVLVVFARVSYVYSVRHH